MLEGLPQARRGLQVQRQGHRPELQIQVDERDSPPPAVGDRPGDARRERGRSNAAASTCHGDEAAEAVAGAALCGALDDVQQL